MEKIELVKKNYEAFKKLLPELLRDNSGRHALMREEALVEVFDTARDAMAAGSKLFPDGDYSIQEVSSTPVNLGYWSYA